MSMVQESPAATTAQFYLLTDEQTQEVVPIVAAPMAVSVSGVQTMRYVEGKTDCLTLQYRAVFIAGSTYVQTLADISLMAKTIVERKAQAASPAKSRQSSYRTVLRLASSVIGAGFLGATFAHGIGAITGIVVGLLFGILAVRTKPSR